jgi:hypothetical protein|tara:strand:+ start:228 stop:473 length:246 start_codon:yes stop_codon:yes gene_type:complete
MKIVISFLVGVWFAWGFLKHYDDAVFDLWTEAYGVGKDDGYVLGRNDITFEDFSFEQLEAKCMFLYADKGTVFGTKKKGGK